MEKERVIWVDDSQNAISMGFIEYLKLIEDPRQSFKTSHSLLEIIFISVCAYICGVIARMVCLNLQKHERHGYGNI